MSEMRDSNDEGKSVSLTYGDFVRAFDENIELRKQLDGLVQAIYDYPVPDASKSTATELIAWIESVCPWLEEVANEAT